MKEELFNLNYYSFILPLHPIAAALSIIPRRLTCPV